LSAKKTKNESLILIKILASVCLVELLRVKAEEEEHDVAADGLGDGAVSAQPPSDVLGEHSRRCKFIHPDHRSQPLKVQKYPNSTFLIIKCIIKFLILMRSPNFTAYPSEGSKRSEQSNRRFDVSHESDWT